MKLRGTDDTWFFLYCYHFIQNLSSFHLLSKNLKIKKHKSIILPTVSHGYKVWSLNLRNKYRVRKLVIKVNETMGAKEGKWRKLNNKALQSL
jgi:hypothetical protein